MKIENRTVIVVDEYDAVALHNMIVWLEEALGSARSYASMRQYEIIQDAHDAFKSMVNECVVQTSER